MNITDVATKLKKRGIKKAAAIDYIVTKLELEGQTWTPHTKAEFESVWNKRVEPSCPLPQAFQTPAQVIKWIALNGVAVFNSLTDKRVAANKLVDFLKTKKTLVISTLKRQREDKDPFGYIISVKPKGWEFTKQKPSVGTLKLKRPPKTKPVSSLDIRFPTKVRIR